jgi:hypothetical protein
LTLVLCPQVREREIGIFLHLLEETEMNVTLLNLLRVHLLFRVSPHHPPPPEHLFLSDGCGHH